MVKQQKIERKPKKSGPTVISEKTPSAPSAITLDPKYANAPVRAVNFVEVGDMDPAHVQLMLNELGQMHDSARGGIHYFLPVRHGKIGSDIVFEGEWEKIVQATCEVNEKGEIVLKDGAKEILVVREKV
jgi:hypothetical protein